jgi:copper(I)-binding protein
MINRRSVLAGLAASALVLAACGGDDEGSSDTSAAGEATITVEKAWARNSPMEVSNGAAYMEITSSVDDTLVGASVDPSIAATVEIHETVMAEGDMSDTTMAGGDMSDTTMAEGGMSDTTMAEGGMSGAMTMRPINELALPAGETVQLKPGGYHIMLIDLVAPLEVGQTFDLTLSFGSGATKSVSVEVREEAP